MIGARKHGAAVRAFFAVEPGAQAREAAAAVATRLRRAPLGEGVRWVRSEAYHVTLRFLGNVEVGKLPALCEAAAAAVVAQSPFELDLGPAHVLPSPRRPRVVVLELAPQAPLEALAQRLEEVAVAQGCAPERRAFRAHLTLGRVRHRRVPDVEGVVAAPGTQIPVQEVVLFRSDLEREGPRYTALERLPLEGEAGPSGAGGRVPEPWLLSSAPRPPGPEETSPHFHASLERRPHGQG